MTLRQLQYLLAVVDHDLRITAAASTLEVSQPNISKSIKALEEELQLLLFKRKGKRLLDMTEAGARVLDHARTIQLATIELQREASRLAVQQNQGCSSCVPSSPPTSVTASGNEAD